jgi:hypothetical protein
MAFVILAEKLMGSTFLPTVKAQLVPPAQQLVHDMKSLRFMTGCILFQMMACAK